MCTLRQSLILCFFVAFLGATQLSAQKPIWGRGATIFEYECPLNHPKCALAYVPSPNKKRSIAIYLDGDVLRLTVTDGSKRFSQVLNDHWTNDYWVDTEILWSPDSTAFSLTGNPNGYTNQTRIFRITPRELKSVNLVPMQREFVTLYPPCVGIPHPDSYCESLKGGADYNYATFAWTDKHTAVIMAEVPPTGSFGKYLGQVRGYEVDAATSAVLHSISASELQQRWQNRMAW